LWSADSNQITRYWKQEGNNSRQRAHSSLKSTNWLKVKVKLPLCLINRTELREDEGENEVIRPIFL
jgi:hypothetical protein